MRIGRTRQIPASLARSVSCTSELESSCHLHMTESTGNEIKKKDAGMKRKYRVNSYHLVIVKISSTERQGVSSSSQLKYVFKLEENVSWVKAQYSRRARIEGAWKQNSLFPLWPAMTFLLLLRLLPLLGEMLDNLIQSVRM